MVRSPKESALSHSLIRHLFNIASPHFLVNYFPKIISGIFGKTLKSTSSKAFRAELIKHAFTQGLLIPDFSVGNLDLMSKTIAFHFWFNGDRLHKASPTLFVESPNYNQYLVSGHNR